MKILSKNVPCLLSPSHSRFKPIPFYCPLNLKIPFSSFSVSYILKTESGILLKKKNKFNSIHLDFSSSSSSSPFGPCLNLSSRSLFSSLSKPSLLSTPLHQHQKRRRPTDVLNHDITSENIVIVNQHGELVGKQPLAHVLKHLDFTKYDLIQFSLHNADAPLCRIVPKENPVSTTTINIKTNTNTRKNRKTDGGQETTFSSLFEVKEKLKKKKTDKVTTKEILLRETTELHDVQVKLSKVESFLEKGYRVILGIVCKKNWTRPSPNKNNSNTNNSSSSSLSPPTFTYKTKEAQEKLTLWLEQLQLKKTKFSILTPPKMYRNICSVHLQGKKIIETNPPTSKATVSDSNIDESVDNNNREMNKLREDEEKVTMSINSSK